MKYLSTILFALCLGWTWKVIHTESPVPFETHAALQTKLAEIIAKTIEKLKPASANFQMDYLTTEVLANGQVKAHFSYKFDEVDNEKDIIQTGLEGYAILQKEPSVATGQDDNWVVTEVKSNSGTLNFREGIVITAGKDLPSDFDTEGTPEKNLDGTQPIASPVATPEAAAAGQTPTAPTSASPVAPVTAPVPAEPHH